MNTIAQHLQTLEVGSPTTAGGVALFPLFGNDGSGLDYALLEDVLEAGLASVEEKGAGGSVPVLVLINKSDTNVLVLQGDEVVGGKQNRILNISVLAPPRSVVDLPVSCVEQGRWHHVSRKFSPGDKAYLKLRRDLDRQVTASRLATGMPLADQRSVWRSVEEELHAAEASSPTAAMRDAYERKRISLDDFERRLAYVEGATGVICAVRGQMAFAEIFDRPAACRLAWPRLVRSVAFDAGTSAGPELTPSTADARHLLDEAGRASVEEYTSPGLGTDLRLSAEHLTGSALAVNGSAIHCALFVNGMTS